MKVPDFGSTTNDVGEASNWTNPDGILGQDRDELSIYPNPVQSDFTVIVGAGVGLIRELQISDLSGRVWHTRTGQDLQSSTFVINSQSWPVGVYSVTLSTHDEILTNRLIKL